MRRALAVLAILALVLAGADVGVRLLTQSLVSRQLQRSLDLAERPDVSLGGFPFVARMASGRFPSMSVSTTEAEFDGVPLAAIDMRLRGVRFSPSRLVGGRPSTIRAEQGGGSATITASAVDRALRATTPLSVRFAVDRILIRLDSSQAEFETRPVISEGRLVLEPAEEGLPLALAIDLPKFLPGLEYTGVRVAERTATLSFRVVDLEWRVPQA
ncbi:MAG: LmeA family phospholipid-binding protein [Actinomycetota bacterium]